MHVVDTTDGTQQPVMGAPPRGHVPSISAHVALAVNAEKTMPAADVSIAVHSVAVTDSKQ